MCAAGCPCGEALERLKETLKEVRGNGSRAADGFPAWLGQGTSSRVVSG